VISGIQIALFVTMDIEACLVVLDLKRPLTPLGIQRAYRRMVKRWHPDQFASQPAIRAQCEEHLKIVNHAYAVLKNQVENHPEEVCATGADQDAGTDSKAPAPVSPMPNQASFRRKCTHADCGSFNRPGRGVPALDKSGSRHRSARQGARPSFEQILNAADGDDQRLHPQAGPRQHWNNRRRKGLRAAGPGPVSAIRPVRPVSGVVPVAGSD
jgi:DnaJ-class molecular chaperone